MFRPIVGGHGRDRHLAHLAQGDGIEDALGNQDLFGLRDLFHREARRDPAVALVGAALAEMGLLLEAPRRSISRSQ
jgi:hypothetical protein